MEKKPKGNYNWSKFQKPTITKRSDYDANMMEIIRETWDVRRTEIKLDGKRI
jgi:hypothetical protein